MTINHEYTAKAFKIFRIRHVKDAVVLSLSRKDDTDEEERLILTEDDYLSCGSPKKGDLLSDEQAERLRHGHRRYQALSYALRILSAGDNSISLLYQKLRRRNVDKNDAIFAVKYAITHRLIRENEQLERLIIQYATDKLWGEARITAALEAKGYKSSDIRQSLDSLCINGTLDFSAVKRKLFEKKKPQNALAWKKLCISHGFSSFEDEI